MEHLLDASFLGYHLVLLTNVRLVWKVIAIYKHCRLFGLVISNKGKKFYNIDTNGLYYKHITIINDDSRVINKLETSLTDDATVVNYDRHMFIVQATGYQ